MSNTSLFSKDDEEVLIEIMNMGFGAACAELADALNTFITISVPKVSMGSGRVITEFANENILANKELSIVEQGFWGNWNGASYLAIPSEMVAEVLNILGFDEQEKKIEDLLDEERTMIFAQMSSLLINTCVGKISEILKEKNNFSAPHILLDKVSGFSDEVFSADDQVVIAEARFSLNNNSIGGSLYITYNQDSFDWLRESIDIFIRDNL